MADGVGQRLLYVILLGLADEPVLGQRPGAQQQPDGRPREPDGTAQVEYDGPAQVAAAQRARHGQREHCAQLYATDNEPDESTALVRRRPFGHYAVDHGEHERRGQALREPDEDQGGRLEQDDCCRSDDGQQRRYGHAARQQGLVVETATEHGRREVSHQVPDEERAEQQRPHRVRPAERRHVLRQLFEIHRRVHFRIHGHYRHRQIHPDQVAADHA